MKVEVQLLCDKGRLVPTAVRKTMRKYQGLLAIKEVRDTYLARVLTAATLVGADAEPVLPQLNDAAVLYVENGRMRIRGFEIHEGTQYGQSWDVKVLPC